MNNSEEITPVLGGIHFEDTALLCPKCGEANLHHGILDVICRKSPDEDGIKYEIDGFMQMNITPIKDEDIPGRRNNIDISFYCEYCPDECFVLRIIQHKGTTYIKWVPHNIKIEIDTNTGITSTLRPKI